MDTLTDIVQQARRDGAFPYCEWTAFDANGPLEQGASQGTGGRWFDLASLTKLFTTTAILAIGKEKGLALSDNAAQLLGLREGLLGERLAEITLQMLLTHTSGLPAWYPFYTDGRPFFVVLEKILRELGPQAGMVYSDLNFMLLREIACVRTGLSFDQVIQHYVKEPLGIEELSFLPARSLALVPSCRDNRIEEEMCRERGLFFDGFRPHGTTVCGEANDGNAHYYFGGISGHAGLFGTRRAVAALGRFYLSTRDKLFAGALLPQKGAQGRCLGFHTGAPFPTGCGHTGFTGTSLWVDREAGCGMVILTNRLFYDHPPTADMKAFRMAMHQAWLWQRQFIRK